MCDMCNSFHLICPLCTHSSKTNKNNNNFYYSHYNNNYYYDNMKDIHHSCTENCRLETSKEKYISTKTSALSQFTKTTKTIETEYIKNKPQQLNNKYYNNCSNNNEQIINNYCNGLNHTKTNNKLNNEMDSNTTIKGVIIGSSVIGGIIAIIIIILIIRCLFIKKNRNKRNNKLNQNILEQYDSQLMNCPPPNNKKFSSNNSKNPKSMFRNKFNSIFWTGKSQTFIEDNMLN